VAAFFIYFNWLLLRVTLIQYHSSDKVIHGDETTHKMLEGDPKKVWRLWGFLSQKGVYFEIRDSRSGDVASDLLSCSTCQYLMSDAYTGYAKALREANKIRKIKGLPLIQCLYCNAHAIRKFKEADEVHKQQEITDPECEWFVAKYQEIYDLDDEGKNLHPEGVMELRKKMIPIFQEMKKRAEQLQKNFSSKSKFVGALSYFLDYYDGRTSSYLPD